jgi:VWFA-related protein
MYARKTLVAALVLVVGSTLAAQQTGPAQQTGTAQPAAAQAGSAPAAQGGATQTGATTGKAEQAAAAQEPTFRTGVELVAVDVGVVDRQGQPVRGLGPGDFTVTVAGQPRRVISAEFLETLNPTPVAVASGPDMVAISTNEGGGLGRLVVFIVDQSTLETGGLRQVIPAASRFLSRLSFADRSALLQVPVGPNVEFTWNHSRVRDALQRVSGTSQLAPEWQSGSLTEARDIAARNPMALRSVAERECRGSGGGGIGGIGTTTPITSPAPGQGGVGGQPPSGGTGGTGTGQAGGSGSTGGGGGGRGGGGGAGAFGMDACTRGLQLDAESTWRQVQMTSFASLSALRQALAAVGRVRGDKTVVLISGGMPLDEREHTSLLSTVAIESSAARATLFTVFVPASPMSATRRTITHTPMMDQQILLWPLETLAGMTGGGSYRADVGADSVFDRLGRELSGYYRLGVEKAPIDLDGKGRRLRVQVARNGATVRARDSFDARSFEDRNWTARLNDALVAPVPVTSVGVRLTSYLAADPNGSGRLTLMLTGEASRLRSGQATFQVNVRNLEGDELVSGEQPLGEAIGDRLTFSTQMPITPGSYIVRLAVMDSAGRVGSVDHRVEARRTPLGALSASGPLLVRISGRQEDEPHLALDGVRQDERLALQVDLEGESGRPADTDVVFEIAASADGQALVTAAGDLTPGPSERAMLAQAIADVRVLPPGKYVARAKVSSGSTSLGELRRAFSVMEAPRVAPEITTAASTATPAPVRATTPRSPTTLKARAAGTVGKFSVEQVLAPTIMTTYLDRLSARPDAASAATREVINRARSAALTDLVISDALAKEAPVAAPFLKGLSLLAKGQLDPAAREFRMAMRAGTDFYPAMIYLGACYAAGGQDKEAAGAWRTALIKEGDTQAIHVFLSDALMRSGRPDLAYQAMERARARWPDDPALKRRFAVAAVSIGKYEDGFKAVDEIVGDERSEDEPVLALAMLALYEAFVSGKPIDTVDEDRARMTRYADVYRTRGGPSLALVETWMTAAKSGR